LNPAAAVVVVVYCLCNQFLFTTIIILSSFCLRQRRRRLSLPLDEFPSSNVINNLINATFPCFLSHNFSDFRKTSKNEKHKQEEEEERFFYVKFYMGRIF